LSNNNLFKKHGGVMQKFWLAVYFSLFSISASAVVGDASKNAAHSHKPVVAQQPTFQPPSRATQGLYQATAADNYDIMDLYLQQGADINCQNCEREGNTPINKVLSRLWDSNAMNNTAIWLIDHGADVNFGNANGETPLMRSIPLSIDGIVKNQWIGAKLGISQLTKLLLDKGAKTSAKDIQGDTPLAYLTMIGSRNDPARSQAERSGFTSVLVALLEHGANINAANNRGYTALMGAAFKCADLSVETLLAYKADPTIKNKLGETALDIAIAKATLSGQDSNCNNTVKILHNPQQVRQISFARSIQQGINGSTAHSNSAQQGVAIYVGTYAGTFNGSDTGTFQVTILPSGAMALDGYSSRGDVFTGEGKVNSDGSVAIGSAGSGSTFIGSVSQDGVSGTWKNVTYNQAGSFQGKKGAEFVKIQPQAPNPIGGLLSVLNKILAPQ
jgi:ankyrin repeat protein